MNCILNIEIEAPLLKVVEIYTNPDNLPKWQEGFQSHQIIKGNYLAVGTKSKIKFKNRNNLIDLTETIISNKLPNELIALYEHKHVINTTTSRFFKVDENITRFEYMVHDIKIMGLIPKIMFMLFPGMMKKQSQKWLDNFKMLVENKYSS